MVALKMHHTDPAGNSLYFLRMPTGDEYGVNEQAIQKSTKLVSEVAKTANRVLIPTVKDAASSGEEEDDASDTQARVVIPLKNLCPGVGDGPLFSAVAYLAVENDKLKIPQPLTASWLENLEKSVPSDLWEYISQVLKIHDSPYELLITTMKVATLLDIPALVSLCSALLVAKLRTLDKETIYRILGDPSDCIVNKETETAWLQNREKIYEERVMEAYNTFSEVN
eukprot:TRINITY_DN8138_c0_g3_i1.p1 TRINITY_DN8138_c0_g3~~TRINITY_DN8138_c0_g3_i1.p1  ORF type:complete len:225 (+),score=55.09 TRINITY_DN8138_c0_g3_i1:54-728(+)